MQQACALYALLPGGNLARYLRSPEEGESERLLGFPPEGMPAVPHLRPVTVLVDRAVLAAAQRPPGEEHDQQYCNDSPVLARPSCSSDAASSPTVSRPPLSTLSSPLPCQCPRPLAWPSGTKGVLVVTPLRTTLHLTRGVPADLGVPQAWHAERAAGRCMGALSVMWPLHRDACPGGMCFSAMRAAPNGRQGRSLLIGGAALAGFYGAASIAVHSKASCFVGASRGTALHKAAGQRILQGPGLGANQWSRQSSPLCWAADRGGLQRPGLVMGQPMGRGGAQAYRGVHYDQPSPAHGGSAAAPGVNGRQVLRFPGWGPRARLCANLTLARRHAMVLKPSCMRAMPMCFL